MIALTSEQDKAQLKEHALFLIQGKHDCEGLIIIVEVLKDTDFKFEPCFPWLQWLRYSITLNKIELVKYLLKQKGDVNQNRGSALSWAANLGRLEIVKCLVEHGANIHSSDDYALYEAASCGHLEVVKYLVEQGANIRSHHSQALHRAKENNHVDVSEYLVEVLKNDNYHK